MENENQQVTEYKIKPINPNEQKKMLVEVLLPIEKDEKELLDEKVKILQEQIDKLGKKANQIRVLWYANDGTKTKYELDKWLITMSNCVFYVILNVNEPIKDGYLKQLLNDANKLFKAIGACKQSNLVIKKTHQLERSSAPKTTYKDDFADFETL
jgi:hypothetical protein